MDFDPLAWIVMPIFLGGLARLFFGGSTKEEPQDERWGPGYYESRDEAERHGAGVSTNDGEDGPGYYD